MRGRSAALALASAVAGVNAARSCGSGTAQFQHRIIDVRYDSTDSNGERLATIAASLGSSTTPLYECVAQWPEAWGGWYQGSSTIIWSDCIWTGAGAGADETVSFAVDWKNRTMYMAHTFSCSDKPGSKGMATGSTNLDLNCTTADDATFCIPKSTSTGASPNLRISTKLAPTAVNATSTCTENSKHYQSWKVESWERQYKLVPGSPASLSEDTGPSFTLRNVADNSVFKCTASRHTAATFNGACTLTTAGNSTIANFNFDTKLNILTISQEWDCGAASPIRASGVSFMQAACDRNFNSNVFTCRSDPVWIGTGTF